MISDLDHQVTLDGVVCHRSGLLEDGDIVRRFDMNVTSPLRTVIDLSGPLTVPELGKVVDDFLRRGMLQLEDLRERVSRTRSAPGRSAATLRKVLAKRLPGYDAGRKSARRRESPGSSTSTACRVLHISTAFGTTTVVIASTLRGQSGGCTWKAMASVGTAGDGPRRRRSSPERAGARRLDADRDHLEHERCSDR